MKDTYDTIVPSIYAAASGIIGVIGFLTGYNVFGWIGALGFVGIILWLTLTAPKSQGSGDGGNAFGVWINGDNGADGGSVGGGDGGGG